MSDTVSPLKQPAPEKGNEGLTAEVATLIVAALNLEVAPAQIDPDAPLYGEGLGLKELQFDEKANRAVFAIPGTSVALRMHVQSPDEGGREPGTVSGVVFSHHDPKSTRERILKHGGSITVEPHTITPPGFTTTMLVFADPDGNEFVLRTVPVRTG